LRVHGKISIRKYEKILPITRVLPSLERGLALGLQSWEAALPPRAPLGASPLCVEERRWMGRRSTLGARVNPAQVCLDPKPHSKPYTLNPKP